MILVLEQSNVYIKRVLLQNSSPFLFKRITAQMVFYRIRYSYLSIIRWILLHIRLFIYFIKRNGVHKQ